MIRGNGDSYTLPVQKPKERKPVGIPMHRWEDVKIDLKQNDWIQLPHVLYKVQRILDRLGYSQFMENYCAPCSQT
jgi:hypothetical protein